MPNFFPDIAVKPPAAYKEIESLVTRLLLSAATMKSASVSAEKIEKDAKQNNVPPGVEILRRWLKAYRQINFSPISVFAPHVKISKQSSYYYYYSKPKEQDSGNAITLALSELRPDVWYSAPRFLSETFLKRGKEVEPIVFSTLNGSLSYVKNSGYSSGLKEKISKAGEYREIVVKPIVQGSLFLFAAMGLVEIAYDMPPESSRIQDKKFISIFGGIQGFRLTALGAYLLGITKSYTPVAEPDGEKSERGRVVLDEHRLLASLTGRNPGMELMLQEYMSPLARNNAGTPTEQTAGVKLYQMDARSFLRNCSKAADVKKKIERFKKRIGENLPVVWEEFLLSIAAKIEPLKEEQNYRVFAIKSSSDLAGLIVRDPVIKKFVLKAEGYKILVRADDVGAFRRELEKHGYLFCAADDDA